MSAGEFDRVSEVLRECEKGSLRFNRSYLIAIAFQLCQACIRLKTDMGWHDQVQLEEDRWLHEFQQDLINTLSLIRQPELRQNQTVSEEMLDLYSRSEQANLGLWKRVQAFFHGVSPTLAGHAREDQVKEAPPPIQMLLEDAACLLEQATTLPPEVVTALPEEAPAGLPEKAALTRVATTPPLESAAGFLEETTGGPTKSIEEPGPVSPSLIVYCLGTFHLYREDREITDWHSFKGRDIFKYLLMHRERPVNRDILIDIFWPDTDPRAARRNLHQTIYSLRQTLRGEQPEFNHIWFKNDCYSLNPGLNIWLDFDEFEQHAQAGARLEKAGRIPEAIERYGTAEGLYQGDFLEEDLYEDWPAIMRERLLNVYLGVVDRLCDLYFQNCQYTVVVSLCQKVLAKDHCNEAAHRWLMLCYQAHGQRHLAIRQYHACVKALSEDLNLPPSDETAALYQRMVTKGAV